MKQKMRTFVLNKIVRDGIVPSNDEIGAITKWRVLQGEELVSAARQKVKEETQELFAEKEVSIGEFADSIEALFYMARVCGYEKDEVLAAMQKKTDRIGAFTKNIYVETVSLPRLSEMAQYYASDPDRFPEITSEDLK